METKGYTINNIPMDTLELLHDARARVERQTGCSLAMQSYLRKVLQDAANAEKALQQAASEEYAQQQSEDARS